MQSKERVVSKFCYGNMARSIVGGAEPLDRAGLRYQLVRDLADGGVPEANTLYPLLRRLEEQAAAQ